MEPILKNSATLTPGYLLELTRATAPRWVYAVGLVPSALFIGVAVWDFIKRGLSLLPGLLLVAAAALLITTFGAPRRTAQRMAKSLRRKYGKDPTVTLSFGEDLILMDDHEAKTTTEVPYEEIYRIRESAHLILLVLNGGLVLPVDKAGFSLGCEEQLRVLLREKCSCRCRF